MKDRVPALTGIYKLVGEMRHEMHTYTHLHTQMHTFRVSKGWCLVWEGVTLRAWSPVTWSHGSQRG